MHALLKLHEALDKFGAALPMQDIIFAVRQQGDDGHWYANFGYFATGSNKKVYKAGGKLCRLNLKTQKLTTLIDDPEGGVRDPVVHYDGKKILFSWRKTGVEYYHLYEINADGTGLRQLTDGPYDDLEPIYLPDDEIMFVSSRCNRWVQCWYVQVATIYRCDKNGKNIRRISANIEQDNTPWVMPDGRIMYTRWEYIDRSRTNFHHLWFMNPDGVGQMVMYGNMHPRDLFIDAKPIPGSPNRIVMVNSPGHGAKEHAGWISIVRTDQGPDLIEAQRIISKSRDFRDPYPLSLDSILVAQKSKILLMNGNGDTSEVYSNPDGTWVHEPRPLMSRKREPVIPSQVNESDTTGKLILIDAYIGRNMEGIAKGEIKKLLILENLPKPINFSGWMEPIACGGSFTLNRIIGTVPVEPDGSAYMELPALRSLQLVALDKDDQSVKRMQSFLTVMPGELTTCIGCHEDRTTIAPNTRRVMAMKRPASRPEPVSDVPEIYDYPRDIQPIWDKHCLRCHDVDKRKGGVLMTGDMGPIFTHSYFTLSSRLQIADGRDLARGNYAPRQLGSSASYLMDKINGSHHKVKVTDAELKLVKFWIESSATFAGTYASLGTGMIGAYGKNADRFDRDWPSTKAGGVAIKNRCANCHSGNKILPLSPSDDIGLGKNMSAYGENGKEKNPPWVKEYGDGTLRVGSAEWMKKYANPKLQYSRHIVYNLSRPDKSLLLLAPLSKDAGGYGICGDVFASTDDADYKTLLTAIADASQYLKKITRFSMKEFKPSPHYIREMKRYGILPQSYDISDPIDVYETDRKYWKSMW